MTVVFPLVRLRASVLLSLLVALLPLLSALPGKAVSGSSGLMGMGNHAPLVWDGTTKRISTPPSSTPRFEGGTFEIAIFSSSAYGWQLAGQFLGYVGVGDPKLLLLVGRLQLEGG